MSDDLGYASKKSLAADRMRHAIRIGQYQPGQRLRQNDLARDLGLSSTPVREALTELQASGLLVHESHRGMRVASLDLPRVRQLYSARKIVEREVSRLAFSNLTKNNLEKIDSILLKMDSLRENRNFEDLVILDETFHLTIMQLSGNYYLVKMVRTLWEGFPRYLLWNIDNRIDQSFSEHKRMVGALRERDEAEFLRATEQHTDNSLTTIVDHLTALRTKQG